MTHFGDIMAYDVNFFLNFSQFRFFTLMLISFVGVRTFSSVWCNTSPISPLVLHVSMPACFKTSTNQKWCKKRQSTHNNDTEWVSQRTHSATDDLQMFTQHAVLHDFSRKYLLLSPQRTVSLCN